MITKAILPVGGLGTRFLPATKAQPKEMLPIFDTPAIQHIVEEAVEAGITDIIIVTGPGKRAIEDHFDTNASLESILQARGKQKELDLVRDITALANFTYARQDEPLGDGHALLCARHLIAPDESVVVLFGDDLVHNPEGKNAVQQLLDIHEKTQDPVVLLENVKPEDVDKYGIVEMMEDVITGMVEKPSLENAPSTMGVVGKFVITPEIWNILEQMDTAGEELRLTNALQEYIGSGKALRGKVLEGVRFDTGDKIGFLKATFHYAHHKYPELVKETFAEMWNKS